MKRRGFLQKLGLGALAVPFVARLEVEAQEVPRPLLKWIECTTCNDTKVVIKAVWRGPNEGVSVYGSDGVIPDSPFGSYEQHEFPCPDCSPTPTQEPEFACDLCKDVGEVFEVTCGSSVLSYAIREGHIPKREFKRVACPRCSPTPEYAEGMLGSFQRARDECDVPAPDYFACSKRTREVLIEELRADRGDLGDFHALIVEGIRCTFDPTLMLPYGIFVFGSDAYTVTMAYAKRRVPGLITGITDG